LADRVRAGAQPYFGPRPRVGSVVGDKMFDGVIPLGRSCAAAQSFWAVHAYVSAGPCRELAAAHRCDEERPDARERSG
jgi:hypothetical protein